MIESVWVEKIVEVDGVAQWQPQELKLDTEGDFTIDELNLNKEVCRMGMLLLKYGDLAGELQAELQRKEEYLKYLKARLQAAHRSQAERNGKKKTVAELESDVTIDEQYQAALAPLHVLRATAVKADHWWRSMNTKARLLEALAFRQSAEIRRGNY
jgi:hypothetical protein